MNTWLQRLFVIPPELADQPWHVTFRLQPSAWMLLILSLAVILLATWGYVRLRGSRLHRGMLAATRAGSIALVLALILEPVIEWPREREELDSVIVLVDRSRSMEVRDERTPGGGGESRDAKARRLLADPVWERIGRRHQLCWFGFGGSATPLQDPRGTRSIVRGPDTTSGVAAAGSPCHGGKDRRVDRRPFGRSESGWSRGILVGGAAKVWSLGLRHPGR